MTAITISRENPNQAILISVVLSVLVTLLLWGLQALFHFNAFWMFVIYILILLLLFYVIMPRIFNPRGELQLTKIV